MESLRHLYRPAASVAFLLLIPVAFVLIGAGLAHAGLAARRSVKDFQQRAVRVEAEVTGLRSEWGRVGASTQAHRRQLFFPTLRFPGPGGETIEVEAASGSNPPPAQPGERVTALYLPEDPRQVRVEGFWAGGTLATGCLTTVGFVFLAVGVLILAVAIAAGALS